MIDRTHIRAVLAATSSLDVHERTHLDRGGVVEFPVNSALLAVNRYSEVQIKFPYSSKSQLHQRRIIDLLDLLFRPIVPRGSGFESTLKNGRLRGRPSRDGGDGAIFPHKRLRPALLE